MAIPALQGDMTDPKFGPPGIINATSSTVLIEGRPAATVGDPVTPHGNPFNPHAPGFNPPCAAAVIADGLSSILVEGKPLAKITSRCSCGLHFIELVGATSVQAGE